MGRIMLKDRKNTLESCNKNTVLKASALLTLSVKGNNRSLKIELNYSSFSFGRIFARFLLNAEGIWMT